MHSPSIHSRDGYVTCRRISRSLYWIICSINKPRSNGNMIVILFLKRLYIEASDAIKLSWDIDTECQKPKPLTNRRVFVQPCPRTKSASSSNNFEHIGGLFGLHV